MGHQNLPKLLLIPTLLSLLLVISKAENFLLRGSSISVERHTSELLVSKDKTFSCGFHSLGQNAFWFAIWFTNNNNNNKNKTVVWTANRDRPTNGVVSKLSLRRDGNMALTGVDQDTIWETQTVSVGVERAELLDSGNLVLKDLNGNIRWQSFDFPSDTLLPSQNFTKGKKLVSRIGGGDFASGNFSFFFDNDNVLKLIYDGPEISSIYWPNPDFGVFQNGRTNYNSSRSAVFDEMGVFSSSDRFGFSASDMGFGVKRRLTMDYDGNLRVYSLDESSGMWLVTWEAVLEKCKVHGICGRNGICVYTPMAECACPFGYERVDESDWSKGCKPKFNLDCTFSSPRVKFVEIPRVDFYGFDLNYSDKISLESCRKLCLDDCRCTAFSYRLSGQGLCFTKNSLFNGYKSPNFPGSIFLKVPENLELSSSQPVILNGSGPLCNLGDPKLLLGYSSSIDSSHKLMKWMYLLWFVTAIGVIEIIFVASGWWFLYRKKDIPSSLEEGYRLLSNQFRMFSYRELEKATRNFREELGRGSFGVVYKGILTDDRVVAVKRLGNVCNHGEGLFWAEISTIGKINHMNLVRILGFCSEAKHRILVYEFIENQSLDKYLFEHNSLGWKERFKIASGTAKGLAYLHHECLEWIVHCDIKPENILLDNDFEPKIADFGLSKLSKRDNLSTEMSQIRGTKGYMAPEWASNLPLSAKVDVYSYGVMVLELVKGSRLSNYVDEDNENSESKLTRFVRVVKRQILCGDKSWFEDEVDPRLEGNFNRKEVVTLVEIGLSCVEEDRSKRPTMDNVLQALLQC